MTSILEGFLTNEKIRSSFWNILFGFEIDDIPHYCLALNANFGFTLFLVFATLLKKFLYFRHKNKFLTIIVQFFTVILLFCTCFFLLFFPIPAIDYLIICKNKFQHHSGTFSEVMFF
jgi:hypothetical protein